MHAKRPRMNIDIYTFEKKMLKYAKHFVAVRTKDTVNVLRWNMSNYKKVIM